jgi:hypothetical protein
MLSEHGEPRDFDGVLENREGGKLRRVHQGNGRERRGRVLLGAAITAGPGHGGPAAISGVRRVGPLTRMVWQW